MALPLTPSSRLEPGKLFPSLCLAPRWPKATAKSGRRLKINEVPATNRSPPPIGGQAQAQHDAKRLTAMRPGRQTTNASAKQAENPRNAPDTMLTKHDVENENGDLLRSYETRPVTKLERWKAYTDRLDRIPLKNFFKGQEDDQIDFTWQNMEQPHLRAVMDRRPPHDRRNIMDAPAPELSITAIGDCFANPAPPVAPEAQVDWKFLMKSPPDLLPAERVFEEEDWKRLPTPVTSCDDGKALKLEEDSDSGYSTQLSNDDHPPKERSMSNSSTAATKLECASTVIDSNRVSCSPENVHLEKEKYLDSSGPIPPFSADEVAGNNHEPLKVLKPRSSNSLVSVASPSRASFDPSELRHCSSGSSYDNVEVAGKASENINDFVWAVQGSCFQSPVSAVPFSTDFPLHLGTTRSYDSVTAERNLPETSVGVTTAKLQETGPEAEDNPLSATDHHPTSDIVNVVDDLPTTTALKSTDSDIEAAVASTQSSITPLTQINLLSATPTHSGSEASSGSAKAPTTSGVPIVSDPSAQTSESDHTNETITKEALEASERGISTDYRLRISTIDFANTSSQSLEVHNNSLQTQSSNKFVVRSGQLTMTRKENTPFNHQQAQLLSKAASSPPALKDTYPEWYDPEKDGRSDRIDDEKQSKNQPESETAGTAAASSQKDGGLTSSLPGWLREQLDKSLTLDPVKPGAVGKDVEKEKEEAEKQKKAKEEVKKDVKDTKGNEAVTMSAEPETLFQDPTFRKNFAEGPLQRSSTLRSMWSSSSSAGSSSGASYKTASKEQEKK
ncbi:MAG: hypothetical protein MMC23_002124 [Stictis urceolatum]|nr:hypothetical protein [Stictis urceolata]